MPMVPPLYPYRRPTPPAPERAGATRTGAERADVGHSTRRATGAKPARDVGIDAVRAGSLIVVVLLHSLMVGVSRGDDGGLVTSVALSGSWGFTVASWFFQVMPLFFMAGGFAALTQWRWLRGNGVTASEYVLKRVQRLMVPGIVMVSCVGAALLTTKVCGASDELMASAGLHAVQPLWFLGVYLGATALVPFMADLHERHRVGTLAALAAGVVGVDLLASSVPGLGFLNLVFVWLLMQQLGFLMLDGVCSTWPRRRLFGAAGQALGVLGCLVLMGYSPDMLVNLNPPTMALAALGVAQFFVFQAARPALDALVRRQHVRRVITRLSTLSMGVYLWHLPVALGVVALLGGVGAWLPAPMSGGWWATRLPWLVVVVASTSVVVSLAGRVERKVLGFLQASAMQDEQASSLQAGGSSNPDDAGLKRRMSRILTQAIGVGQRAWPQRLPLAASATVLAVAATVTVLLLGASSWVGAPVAVVVGWTAVALTARGSAGKATTGQAAHQGRTKDNGSLDHTGRAARGRPLPILQEPS